MTFDDVLFLIAFIPLCLNMIVVICIKLIDKKGDYVALDWDNLSSIILMSFIPIFSIIGFFELLRDLKYARTKKYKDKSRIKKITTLEGLPVQISQSSIDKLDRIMVLLSLTDDYDVEATFVEDWRMKEHNKTIKYSEYTFIGKKKNKDNNHYYVFSI